MPKSIGTPYVQSLKKNIERKEIRVIRKIRYNSC
jgi:hypothetical protein